MSLTSAFSANFYLERLLERSHDSKAQSSHPRCRLTYSLQCRSHICFGLASSNEQTGLCEYILDPRGATETVSSVCPLGARGKNYDPFAIRLQSTVLAAIPCTSFCQCP